MSTRRRYSLSEKRDAVALVREVGQAEAASRLGIPHHTLTDWVYQAKEGLYPFNRMTRCSSSAPDLHTIQCQQAAGHDGLHRNNMVTWQEPQIILVNGAKPDLAVNTVHWVDGDVRLSGEPA